MIVKIKHTIETIIEEDTGNWTEKGEFPKTPEELLEMIKKVIQEDPYYVLDGLDKYSIKSEIVEEAETSLALEAEKYTDIPFFKQEESK